MDAVAAFVYASGGVVRPSELVRFFSEHAAVERQFYAAAAPVRTLKKIFRHGGDAHGLAWRDGDVAAADEPRIVHTLTESQTRVFPQTLPQWIPESLDAVEMLLREAPDARLSLHKALSLFHASFPTEAAFMKGRSGGVVQFITAYDPDAARFGRSETELWLVRTKVRTPTGSTTSSSSDEETDAVALSPTVALAALRTLYSVLTQSRVFRSPFSPSMDVLLRQVWRLVQHRRPPVDATRAMAKRLGRRRRPSDAPEAHAKAMLPRPPSPSAPSLPCAPVSTEPKPRRLLVPSASKGLTWTWAP